MSTQTLHRLMHIVAGGLLGLLSMMTLAAPPAPAPSAKSETKSLGCMQATTAHAGTSTLAAKDGSGKDRSYVLQAPPAYSASRSYPLIFVFHGSGGNAKESMSWGLQNAANAATTAIFVFPNGIPYKNYGVGWDDSSNGYDLPLFDAMLKDVGSAYCIDLSRVFVAGFSWGGDFVTALACNRGDAIRAVAANSTDDEFKDTANYQTYQNLPCTSQRHPAVRFQHAIGGDKAYPAPLFATTSKLYQYLNACGPSSASMAPVSSTMSCVSFNACASEYVECAFDTRIGHALPPHWAEDTWAFFSKF